MKKSIFLVVALFVFAAGILCVKTYDEKTFTDEELASMYMMEEHGEGYDVTVLDSNDEYITFWAENENGEWCHVDILRSYYSYMYSNTY